MNIKSILIMIALCGSAFIANAFPHVHRPVHHIHPRPAYHPRPVHVHHHHHPYHYSSSLAWPFWAGFAGAAVGSAIVEATRPTSVVVTTPVVQTPVVQTPVVVQTPIVQAPVVQQKTTWVEGHYEDRIQPNGSTIRVWVPGAWVAVP